ncbi:MAG: hypothetical protein JNL32_15320, partial [Candidatus Kapabacteria bacterium]|nr:hypothetical protein [Candidatus Kapabacteria bacterium]
MKQHKTINELLNSAAAFESKTELWSEDELRSLLADAPHSEQTAPTPPSRVQPTPIQWRNIMLGTTILSGAAAAIVWFTTVQPDTQPPAQVADASSTAAIAQAPAGNTTVQETSVQTTAKTYADLAKSSTRTTSPSTTTAMENSAPDIATPYNVRSTGAVAIPDRIRTLSALTLNKDELVKLGIRSTAQGFSTNAVLRFSSDRPEALNVFMANMKNQQTAINLDQAKLGATAKQFGYENTDNAVLKFGITIDELDIAATLRNNSDSVHAIAPLLITHESRDANGIESDRVLIFSATPEQTANHPRMADELDALYALRSAEQQQRTEIQMTRQRFPLLSKLVAVKVQHSVAGSGAATALLWYYPDEAFLAVLPPDKADAIRKEINALDNYEQHRTDTTKTLLGGGGLKGDYTYTDAA